jgi:hypothetical protein
MCILQRGSVLLTVAWSFPLFFDLVVVAMTAWNAVDRSRLLDQPLASALRKDGMVFFIVMAVLRIVPLALLATLQARLTLLTVLFVVSVLCL